MISYPVLIILICNFIAIGLLPLLFFRRDGAYNLRWLATGAPFFAAPIILLCGYAGIISLPPHGAGIEWLIADGVAVILSVVSIALIAMTVGTHRVPLALWHQDNDAPAAIVTWGPYRHIRHPFYTSFLLVFMAAVLACPHTLTLVCLFYSFVALSVTAEKEEKRLARSEFGDEYRRYMSGSGRFFPRLMS